MPTTVMNAPATTGSSSAVAWRRRRYASRISRVSSVNDAIDAMQEPLDMGIGGTLDCGSLSRTARPWTRSECPAASNGTETAFYDVSATLTFR